jgi:hypothetical protein
MGSAAVRPRDGVAEPFARPEPFDDDSVGTDD